MMNSEGNKLSKKIINCFKNEPLRVVLGLLIVFFCLYITAALLSYIFNGSADQSLVQNLDLKTNEDITAEISNFGGYQGAVLSDWIIAKTFGISSIAIVYFFFRIGTKMMGFLKGNLFRIFSGSLFFTIWGSFFFSFINAKTSVFNWGGHCGQSEVSLVEAHFGVPGAFIILLFTLILFLYFFKGITILEMRDAVVAFYNKIKNFKTTSKAKNIENEFSDKKNESRESATSLINSTNNEEDETNAENEVNDDQNEYLKEADDTEGNEDNTIEVDDDTAEDKEDVPFVIENNQDEVDQTIETDNKQEDSNVSFQINTPTDAQIVTDEDTADIEEPCSPTTDADDDAYNEIMDRLGPYDPTEELSDFEMPSLNLLNDYPTEVGIDEEEQKENKERIVQVLKNFGIEITGVSATVGPTITLYEIVPAPNVRISKIQSLGKELALGLKAKGIRIIAPIPGKGTVGIEVPNKKPQIVSMKSLLASPAFQESKAELPVAFGRTITNEVFMVDLAKTPHLLVAGATGMGKSVGLNVLLTSLLYKKHPATLKIVMVDPKQVEFSIYEKIEKHYLAKLPGDESAIITDTTKVVQTLTSLTIEMENRYTLLADVHLRNIKEYNAKFISRRINPTKELPNGLTHHYLPYIVVVIDEYGDLLMTAGKEIETPIARIAQKARAVGIHMVLATQRPSVKIVTGLIKANFPARLAFRVASRIDSQTILDAPGAQELVGKGDMLYSTGGADNTRVQCAFVDTPEVEEINNFIGSEHGYPEAYRLPEFVDENGEIVGASSIDVKSLDPRLKEAAELVVNAQNGSTSSIQRTLEVGFNRAGRIMDQLQEIGVVGKVCGSKPREVLVHDLLELEIIFNNLK